MLRYAYYLFYSWLPERDRENLLQTDRQQSQLEHCEHMRLHSRYPPITSKIKGESQVRSLFQLAK